MEMLLLDQIKNFLKEIGVYSLQRQKFEHQEQFKEDNDAILSIVTEVDLHNSQCFRNFVRQNFSNLNYVIIDEESIDDLNENFFEKIEQSEYQFIFDPIDGTLNYSSGLPFWGILLSVFKNAQPLYGFIYAPALDELVYTDGLQVFREHFGKTEIVKKPLQNMSRVVQAHCWKTKLKPNHIQGKFIVQDYFSAAIYSLYLSLGQLRAVISTAKLWDVAPLMAIGKLLDFDLYDYDSNQKIQILPKYISQKGKIKAMMFMGSKKDATDIKAVFSEIIET